MTQDISGFGAVINVIGSNTFPSGFPISQFADDGDPLDIASISITETAMGLNGDMVTWSKANPIKVTIAVIAGSPDDINLGILMEANRVGSGKLSARDLITMTAVYPSGNILTLNSGKMTDGMPGTSIASAGRLKTKTYMFSFENKTGVGL